MLFTQWNSDPLLLADDTLHYGMYPELYVTYGWYLRVTSASEENSRFGDSWIRELRDWGSKDSNSVDIELGAVASSNGWKKNKSQKSLKNAKKIAKMAKISNSVVIELGAVASSNGFKKRKISIVKNSRKMPRNSQNGKNISNSVVIELGAVAQVIKINKFRQVWTSLGKVRQDWTRLDRLDKIEQV